MQQHYIFLSDRAVLSVSGDDAADFLQGLVSNDVNRVTEQRAVLAALLSPQGKFLHDFFIARQGDAYLLDTERSGAEALTRRLNLYRLRSDVTIKPRDDLVVTALPGLRSLTAAHLPEQEGTATTQDIPAPDATGPAVLFADPRLPTLGVRVLASPGQVQALAASLGAEPADIADYERLRLERGIPEGSKDATERTLLLENGYDALNGVSFSKGCYVGQEVTARSHHRGTLRKYLFTVRAAAALPPPGTDIVAGETRIGQMRSSVGNIGLALLRREALQQAQEHATPLKAGEVTITAEAPFWHTPPASA